MMQTFLKAKHWQLFLLLFGIPLIFQFILMGSIIADIAAGPGANAGSIDFFNYMKFFPIMMIICIGTFFGWFWSIVIGLQTKLPDGLKMKLTRFKIFFFIPIIYMILIALYMIVVFNGLTSGEPDVINGGLIIKLLMVVIPLHLFSMFCMFHTIYYVAKTVKTVELQKVVPFSDFAGEFFMLWFYPIGVWIIQPKINKMVENEIN